MQLLGEDQPIDVAVISRDGRIAIRLTRYEGTYRIPNRLVVGSYFSFDLPESATGRVAVLFSDHFQFVKPDMFNLPSEMERGAFQLDCACARIGEYLDTQGLLPETAAESGATQLQCFTEQFEMWKTRSAADEDEILNYVRAKLYWSWRFDFAVAEFTAVDCIRLGVSLRTIRRVAQIEEGHLWRDETMAGPSLALSPLPEFLRDERVRQQANTPPHDIPITVLLSPPRYAGPAAHWNKADEFAHGTRRDLPNAVKEAVCAVEGVGRVVTGSHSATLGDAIKDLRASGRLDPAMAKSLEGIWGFASNSPGVRHGGVTTPTITDDDAIYILTTSEAVIRYLLSLDV